MVNYIVCSKIKAQLKRPHGLKRSCSSFSVVPATVLTVLDVLTPAVVLDALASL